MSSFGYGKNLIVSVRSARTASSKGREQHNTNGGNAMFKCNECGKKFKTVKAAERAAFGDNGCPKCGGSDIDIDPNPPLRPLRRAAPRVLSQDDLDLLRK